MSAGIICPDWTFRHAWACGPASMLDDIERGWRRAGIAERLEVERFRPAVVCRGGVGARVLAPLVEHFGQRHHRARAVLVEV